MPAWEFEAVFASDKSTSVRAGLYAGTSVVSSSLVTSTGGANTVNHARATLTDSQLTNEASYTVKLSKTSGSPNASLCKAGIWVNLADLTSAEVYYLVGRYQSLATSSTYSDVSSRVAVDLARYGRTGDSGIRALFMETIAREIDDMGTDYRIYPLYTQGASGTGVVNSSVLVIQSH